MIMKVKTRTISEIWHGDNKPQLKLVNGKLLAMDGTRPLFDDKLRNKTVAVVDHDTFLWLVKETYMNQFRVA
jgi:hypothetical protein